MDKLWLPSQLGFTVVEIYGVYVALDSPLDGFALDYRLWEPRSQHSRDSRMGLRQFCFSTHKWKDDSEQHLGSYETSRLMIRFIGLNPPHFGENNPLLMNHITHWPSLWSDRIIRTYPKRIPCTSPNIKDKQGKTHQMKRHKKKTESNMSNRKKSRVRDSA